MTTHYRLLKHDSGDTFAARFEDERLTGLAGPYPSSQLDPRNRLFLFMGLPEQEYETFGLEQVDLREFTRWQAKEN